jgi:hypothetical protein
LPLFSDWDNNITLFIFFFILNIFCFIFLLFQMKKENSNSRFQQFMENSFMQPVTRILLYPHDAMLKAYEYLFEKIPSKYIDYVLFTAGNFIVNLGTAKVKKGMVYVVIMFECIPRLIILSIFFYEIFMRHTLHYFYLSLTLLLLPLLCHFLIFMLKDLGPRLIKEFSTYIEIGPPENFELSADDKEKYPHLVYANLQKRHVRFKVDEGDDINEFMHDRYYPMCSLPIVLQPALDLRNKLKLYLLLIYHLAFIIGWGYVLCMIYFQIY